ncbi:MAG: hypothetical protein IJS67_02835, partial [Clostridia bacterium]|nr:hypothetical protein [Clostridia bacterium]
MSNVINYKHVVGIIANMHNFIDEAEAMIKDMYAEYNSFKNQATAVRNNSLMKLQNQYRSCRDNLQSKSQQMIDDAQAIYDEIL